MRKNPGNFIVATHSGYRKKRSIVKRGDRATHVVGIFTIRREGSEKTNLPSMVVGYSPATTTPELVVV